MLICSGSATSNGGSALLYTSDTLELKEDGNIDMNWEYRGPIYEMENQSVIYGTSWELPILLPLTNKNGQTKYFFSISPAPASTADNKVYYFIGDFDLETGRFTPDKEFENNPHMLDYGDNVFTGPSALTDPQTGDIYLFSIMQDKRSGAEEGSAGWAHCVGLPRKLTLNDSGTDVCIEAAPNIKTLENKSLLDADSLTLEEANEQLSQISEDLLHITATITAENATEFGIELKSNGKDQNTKYWYDTEANTINASTTNRGSAASPGNSTGKLQLEDNTLAIDIYIDRSLVEGYFNHEKAISIRSYSDYDAQGISFFADADIIISDLHVAELNSIY